MKRWLVVALCVAGAQAGTERIRFRVSVDAAVAERPVGGRLLVFMLAGKEPKDRLGVGFLPGRTWVAAREVRSLAAGEEVEIDPDALASPKPFSQAAGATYQFMALLDRDHSYAHSGQGKGDLVSEVTTPAWVNPGEAGLVRLRLTREDAGPPGPALGPNVELFETESRLLTAFWGRPVMLKAGVVLPPGYAKHPREYYPASYSVHPFVGDAARALERRAPVVLAEMKSGKRPELVHVYLDASIASGHHGFADSVNNGPWGQALVQELIPALERRYRLAPRPNARFLTGHSSGGWSTLWLQVNYPAVFGGTWSTGPDPVDFRSFTGVDVTPGSKENFFRTAEGEPRVLLKWKSEDEAPVLMEDFVRQESVLGAWGGQFASFDAVFSPRGPDGRPMPLFDRVTGMQDPAVQQAWRKYDIRALVESNWKALGPQLRGKIRIVVGTEDNFSLDRPAAMLCEFLERQGEDDACEFVEGRDHMDLYRPFDRFPDGLDVWIAREMMRRFEHSGEAH